MILSLPARACFAVVATIAVASEVIFLVANAHALGSILRAIGSMLAFLTDWTGLLVAIVGIGVALGSRRLTTPYWIGLATLAIVLVGTMFGALGGWGRLGPRSFDTLFGVSSLLAHVVVPATVLLVWLAAVPHGELRWRDAPGFMLYPLAYLVEMFGRGLLGGGYPYPQVDVATVGWGPALTFAAAVTLLFLVLGLLLVAVDRLLARGVVPTASNA